MRRTLVHRRHCLFGIARVGPTRIIARFGFQEDFDYRGHLGQLGIVQKRQFVVCCAGSQ
jgi:hypothetical protein